MAKKKSDLKYWERRFLDIEERRDKLDKKYIKNMESRYSKLSKNLNDEIDSWMSKYAINDEITESAAKTLLSRQEQREWQITLDEFKDKAVAGGYEQQLNREYYRSRITRLQQLKNQLSLELANMAHLEEGQLELYLEGTLEDTYMENLYELSDRGEIALTFAKFDKGLLNTMIYAPWASSNFSKRVWSHHLKYLPDKLSNVLSLGTNQGWGIDRMTDLMMEGIDENLKNRMITLVQNESAHFAEEASQKAYKETGVDEYEWLATLETSTCEQCGDLDGETFVIGSSKSKLPIIDTHVNCRCTTVPVITGWTTSKRWHRNPETGKGEIIKNIPFNDWRKKYDTVA